jgi:hypothetical protein
LYDCTDAMRFAHLLTVQKCACNALLPTCMYSFIQYIKLLLVADLGFHVGGGDVIVRAAHGRAKHAL